MVPETPETARQVAPTSPNPAPEPSVPTQTIPWYRRGYLRLAARWAMVALAIYAITTLLINAQAALTPFVIGLVLAYLLLPLVNRLNRRMPRWLAILLVYIGLGISGGIAVAYIIPPAAEQIGQLIASIPSVAQLEQIGADIINAYRTSVPADLHAPIDAAIANTLRSIQGNLSAYAQSIGGFVLGRALQIANTVINIAGLLIVPIWLFFVLNDQAKGSAAINQILHPALRTDFWSIWSIVNAVLSNYVRGQLILGVAVGSAVGLGLLGLGLLGFQIPYILLLAIIAGITELIPILGPIVGSIPGILIAFTISPAAGLATLVLYVLVQQLENNLLVPRIVGESIGIHPAVLSVVLIAMGQVFGIVGIILSAPIAAITRDLFVYTYQRLHGATPHAARAAVREYARNEEPIRAT